VPSVGTISMMGMPGCITPPTVLTWMMLTEPLTGDLITVRLLRSARMRLFSDIWASSDFTFVSSSVARRFISVSSSLILL